MSSLALSLLVARVQCISGWIAAPQDLDSHRLAGDTRFYTEYIAFTRALKVKAHLQETVVSADWGAWADKHTYKAEAARVKRLILDDDMWAEIEVMEQLFKRVVQLLGLVDSNMPTLGKVSKCHADMLLQSMSRLMSALMAFLLCL